MEWGRELGYNDGEPVMKWQQDVGYEDGVGPVAHIFRGRENGGCLTIKVMGGKPADNYFVSNTISPITSATFGEAKKIAEVTRRVVKNQPSQESAQAAIRAYARLKGERWWDDG